MGDSEPGWHGAPLVLVRDTILGGLVPNHAAFMCGTGHTEIHATRKVLWREGLWREEVTSVNECFLGYWTSPSSASAPRWSWPVPPRSARTTDWLGFIILGLLLPAFWSWLFSPALQPPLPNTSASPSGTRPATPPFEHRSPSVATQWRRSRGVRRGNRGALGSLQRHADPRRGSAIQVGTRHAR